MLVDANILLYAVDADSRHHERAAAWLSERLSGPGRIALPWEALAAFLRIATHPRASRAPMSADAAWSVVAAWLDRDVVWCPGRGPRHGHIVERLVRRHAPTGNLVPDMLLVALALEHGLAIASADGDFARFDEILWINPLAA